MENIIEYPTDKISYKEQLQYYKKALFYYQLSYIFPFLKRYFKTQHGFCDFFTTKCKILNSFGNNTKGTNGSSPVFIPNIERLTVLYSLKPSNSYRMLWWFNPAHIKPRIELLKKAIEITEIEMIMEFGLNNSNLK